MRIIRTIIDLRQQVAAARRRTERIGLVPTMGSFHEGHLTLIRRAREQCGLVIVSLFVNPTQFNESIDLERYPRDEARDADLAAGAGAHILFAPSVDEVYPRGFATTVEVAGVSDPLEGMMRGPKHFRGVATVVAKLLNIVHPDDAFFGQKDAQQALLILRMVLDLDIPVRVEVCPTIREADGLAMSSRNVLLDVSSRARAPVLYEALCAIARDVSGGERDVALLLARGAAQLERRGVAAEYLAVVRPETMEPVVRVESDVLVAVAARFGAVRLIDNLVITPPPDAYEERRHGS